MEVTDIFWPDTLPLPLIGAMENISPQGLNTVMDSGRTRHRQRALDYSPLDTIAVQWVFTEDGYASFLDFFRDTLKNGQNIFWLIVLREEQPVIFFDPNYSFSRGDNQITVSATLLILALDEDERICQEGDVRLTQEEQIRIVE